MLVYEKIKNESLIVGLPHVDKGFKFEDEYVDERGNEYINHFHTHVRDLDFKKYKNAIIKYGILQ